MKATRRLVVTADDFGASADVNEAVERAYRDGILTSASLLVGGPEAVDAVKRARRMPNLGVGLHLAIIDALPVSAPASIPDLVDASGRLRSDQIGASLAIFTSPGVRRQLRTEIKAQFDAFERTGLTLDHVDAHHHMHLHPTLHALLIEMASAYKFRYVRWPYEPKGANRGSPLWLRPWIAALRRRLDRHGICLNDGLHGIAWSGAMTVDRVHAILENIPNGLQEIYFHPRYDSRSANTDLTSLLDPSIREALTKNRITLTTYSGT